MLQEKSCLQKKLNYAVHASRFPSECFEINTHAEKYYIKYSLQELLLSFEINAGRVSVNIPFRTAYLRVGMFLTSTLLAINSRPSKLVYISLNEQL